MYSYSILIFVICCRYRIIIGHFVQFDFFYLLIPSFIYPLLSIFQTGPKGQCSIFRSGVGEVPIWWESWSSTPFYCQLKVTPQRRTRQYYWPVNSEAFSDGRRNSAKGRPPFCPRGWKWLPKYCIPIDSLVLISKVCLIKLSKNDIWETDRGGGDLCFKFDPYLDPRGKSPLGNLVHFSRKSYCFTRNP